MRSLAVGIAGVVLMTAALLVGMVWMTCRIYVPADMCAVLIRKTGTPLPEGQLVATQPGQTGIQAEVLGPGRYFYDPIRWEWKLVPLTTIPAGDPRTWEWTSSLSGGPPGQLASEPFTFKGKFPMVGVVTRKVGLPPPVSLSGADAGQTIVARTSGCQGILREVLTPGTYKINPYVFEVQLHPATVIPAGFVGVVTNLVDDAAAAAPPSPAESKPAAPAAPADAVGSGDAELPPEMTVRPLALPGRRGTQHDVLQPGVYFINPKLQKVTLFEIGFNEFSELPTASSRNPITFPSDTGYMIQIGVTVVWGIDPQHAAEVLNEFGNVDGVLDKVIQPQLRSICRNIGSTYAARDFIHGEKRELFQKDLTQEMQRICRLKNIEVLLALVREIEVVAPDSGDGTVPADLRRTIQESFVAVESRLTMQKQTEAATVRAHLEEIRKQIDIARENIVAQSRLLVAEVKAQGQKTAAQTDAQTQLQVATIQQEVAELQAQRTEILGQARADVQKMKKAAEAEGYRLLIEAFGSAKAFNLYTFAQNFKPDSIRLFFAGEGTFWTDLKRFEEIGAANQLQSTKPVKD